jgi:CheY-like chemotaxis protein
MQTDSGAKALSYLEQHSSEVDLLLSDVVMAKMTGVELAVEVQERFPKVKILLMSASAEPHEQLNGSGGLDASGFYLLQKPFSAAVLTEKVRKTIDSPQPSRRTSDKVAVG